jgi:hypothetical protein
MIDPVSALGMATAAYRGLKSAIDTGKELSDMAGTLNQWATSMSDLDFAHRQAENPPMFKKLFGATQVEQNALEVWGHKQKAKEMRDELQSYISLFYGPSAWKEIVAIEAKMRKERKQAIYEAEERKQLILEWIVGILFAGVAALVIGFFIWYAGGVTGKW